MKAFDVIEELGLDVHCAVDALMNYFDSEFICEKLCDVIDEAGGVEDFAEFMEMNFRRTADPSALDVSSDLTQPSCAEPTAAQDGTISDDEEFLRQLAEMDDWPTESEIRSPAASVFCATPATETAQSLTDGDRKFPEYVPDEWDMNTMAWAYLDEGIALKMHTLTTGWSGKYWHRFQRFELIAKHLGESERMKVIDAMDEHQARQRGDEWQVFKASCGPGFWSTPADRAAILRVANSHSEQLSNDDAGCYGREYLEILRGARTETSTNDTGEAINPEGVAPEESN